MAMRRAAFTSSILASRALSNAETGSAVGVAVTHKETRYDYDS